MVKNPLRLCLEHVFTLAGMQTAREQRDHELLTRFVADKDQAAFTVLVERHGRMVLGVCRRLLGSAHDAEDACQAAFLVLAQRAASIRKTTSLSSWLHGVAWRVAAHLRRERLRRSRCERDTKKPAVADPATEVSWREVQTVLDEELERLPETLRAPLILCYLDGQTRDAAARQLGVSVTCLHGRLERGRKTLCRRLIRRGIALSAALMGTALGEGLSQAALAPTAVLSTARAAVQIACGGVVPEGLVSTRIGSLAQEVTRHMVLTKLKLGALGLLCAGLLAAALGGALAPAGAGEAAQAKGAASSPQPAARRSGSVKPADPQAERTTIRGTVLGPDGKPVPGAKVYLLKWKPPPWLKLPEDKGPPKVRARTGADGRFSLTVANRDLGELFVTAAGYGPGWVIKPGRLQETWPIENNQVVRLARDDVPVRGRFLDLQGRPVSGATIRVYALKASPDGNLDKFIKAVKNQHAGHYFPEHEYLSSYRVDGLRHFFPPVTSDKAGRFQIKGVGRERIVAFTVEGPAIETKVIHAVTRPGLQAADLRIEEGTIVSPTGMRGGRLKPYYPPDFTHVAAPGRVVTGVVRDQATGKPIAAAVVRSEQPVRYPLFYNRTVTDKDGRFRLTGMPLNARFGMNASVVALPHEGEPYLALLKSLPEDKAAREVRLDFDLAPGVWLEGQVKDKTTGRGVQAQVRYFRFVGGQLDIGLFRRPGEPSYYWDLYKDQMTDPEGKYRLVIARGRGVIGARATGPNRYRTGVGANKIKGIPMNGGDGTVMASPAAFSAGSFNTLVEVNPPKGTKRLPCDILLDPGRTLVIQVRGPDGKRQGGVRVQGLWASAPTAWAEMASARFNLYALEPGKKQLLLLEHPGKNLVARREIKGDERGPIVITLQPAGRIVGRVVDEQGRPFANAEVTVMFRLAPNAPPRFSWRHFQTDADGKFRIDGVLPGASYHAHVGPPDLYTHIIFENLSVPSGKTKDLGKVKPRKFDG